MLEAQVTGSWKRKLGDMVKEVRQAGQTDCRIKPTKVLYELSQKKQRSVLEAISSDRLAIVRKEGATRVKAAITGKPTGWRVRASKEYRRWAYRFVEELLVSIRDRRTLGVVTNPSTLRAKRAAPKNGGCGRGVPPESWGVRHTRPDWRQIQKGRRSSGKRRPDLVETEKLIEVLLNGVAI